MKPIFLTITEDEWLEKYKPVDNPRDGTPVFETYGEDVKFLNTQNPLCIWTELDTGEGGTFIKSGIHFVNRICYFLTENPVNAGEEINVEIESEEE